MATSDIPDSRSRRRKVTLALIVLLWLVTYWPGGPILEQTLSPTAFLLWVVIVIPGLAALLFMYNAYKNIQFDEDLEARSTGGDEA